MKTTEFLREFNEKDTGEYNDEAGMALSNLETICRSAQELEKHIGQEENMPEWCQEKLAVVKGMLVAVTDYMVSQDALDDKQDDFAFDTDRIAEQLNNMLEGGPYDLPGKDYPRPGDAPRKRPSGEHNPYPYSREEDDAYFNDIFRKKREAAAKAKEQGVAEAGNQPLEKSRFGMGDTRTPRDIKSQMSQASDEFVRSTADKKTGPFHSKVAKMQGKMAKSELRKREQGVAEGQGNLAKALDTLSGSWSGWHQVDSYDPNIEKYEWDDGEGGFYAGGSIEHNLKSGEVTVNYHGEYDDEVKGTFKNMGDAMRAVRGGYPGSHGGRAPNFDRLGQRTPYGPDDLRKTDRTGRKGTVGGGFANARKASIQHSLGRHGPKGVLPEQGVAEKITPPGNDDMEQYRKDTADMAKRAIANKTPMSKNPVNEFAGGMGAASVATTPGVGKGPKVGSLFGGSYAPKTPFNKKRKR